MSQIHLECRSSRMKKLEGSSLERGKERGQKSEDNSNCLETFIQRTQKGRTRREGRTSFPGPDGGGERSPREAMPRDRRKHAPPELHQVNGRRHDDSASKAALTGHLKATGKRLAGRAARVCCHTCIKRRGRPIPVCWRGGHPVPASKGQVGACGVGRKDVG